jgi:PPOX class probable F420-dependent enzyme
MTVLSDDARRVLEQPRLAHLVTLNADGSPQGTTVWVGLAGRRDRQCAPAEHQKVRNIRNDPRVALSIEAEGRTNGFDNYLVVYGRARITEGGAPDLLQRLAETYLGPGVKYPPMADPPPGYVTHVAGERVAGIGPFGLTAEACLQSPITESRRCTEALLGKDLAHE